MRDLKGIEKELEELKVYLSYDLNIIALYIFGSYGTEEQDERSDIDFAVLYDRNVSLEEELELEVKISDIFQRDDIDVINLNKAPISLQHNVIYTGDLIYCSGEVKLADFKEKVFNIYGDYGITLKFFHDDYLKGLSDK